MSLIPHTSYLVPLKWGVLGVSELAGRKAVLPALQRSAFAEVVAIGSRSFEHAQLEASAFGARRAYGDYASVLTDPDVEAVYVPLPNALHLPWVLAAAKAGKHVLCEKPLACTAAEARQMAAACEAAGVVLMEAYMTQFHPRSARVLELARSGRLGAIRFAHAAFTFTATDPLPDFTTEDTENTERPIYNSVPSAPSAVNRVNYRWLPEMGGGALLDVGIYCLAPLLAIAGREPERVAARAVTGPTGVDVSFSGWLDFGGGFTAGFETSFEAPERQVLEITGTDATLLVEHAFTPNSDDTHFLLDGNPVACDANDPYQAMVEHFVQVVRGEAAPLRTPEDSIRTLSLLDRLREAATQS